MMFAIDFWPLESFLWAFGVGVPSVALILLYERWTRPRDDPEHRAK